jgi:hypothetical protein
MSRNTSLIPAERVEKKIIVLRGVKVILDQDLAELYEIETRALNQAVRRNLDRFPKDFMFSLTAAEVRNLRSQFVISSWGGRRYRTMAFTEEGVAMLSSVLRSPRAVKVNIAIMRVFVKLRHLLATHQELAEKLRELEGRLGEHDHHIDNLFQAIRQILAPVDPPRRRIGFPAPEEPKAKARKRVAASA